jgi:hypothetical protein
MTGRNNHSEQQDSAALLPVDRSGFVRQHPRHGLFEDSLTKSVFASKPEGAA